jgi:CubicO group peptidase (beta-lactamase class C family)
MIPKKGTMTIPTTLAALAALTAAPAEPLPDTVPGRAAKRFIEAVNSGDQAALGKIAVGLTPDPMRWTTTANDRLFLLKLREQSGGIDVEKVVRPEHPLMFNVLTRKGGRRATIMLGVEPDGRITQMGFRPQPDPATEKRDALPEGKLNQAGVINAIRKYLDRRAADDRWSGVVLIAKGDRLLLHTAHGYADRSFRVPIQKDTRFDQASTPKMFTAAVMAQLAQEGKLSLDDTVGRHLPDYPDAAVREKVTLRHLLGHTAGTGTIFDSPGYDRTQRFANASEMLTVLHGEPLKFEPGSRWSYSNGGFVMLGAIAERLEGKPFRQIVRDRVYTPLGMKDTDVRSPLEVVPNLAHVYDQDPLDPFGLEGKRLDSLRYGMAGGGPHGGGYSTATDLLRFARALRTNRLISPERTAELTTPGKQNPTYGLGFDTRTIEGQRVIGHNGHARSAVYLLWDMDVTVIAVGNDLSQHAPGVAFSLLPFIAKNGKGFK